MSFMSMDAQAKRSSWSPSVSQDAKENQAGVGILFVEEEDPSGFVRVTVKALIEGGSAEKTGMVKAGDMVVRVGNQDVIGKPLSILRSMIPGPIGSYCRLGFLRGGVALNSNAVQEKSTYFDVQLLRQPTKNEKRKLVAGGVGDLATSDTPSGSSSLYSSQSTQKATVPLSNVEPATRISEPAPSNDAPKLEETPTRTIPLTQAQPSRESPPAPRPESWSANKAPSPLSTSNSWSEGDAQASRKTWSPSVLGAFQNQVQQQLQSSYTSSQQRASAQQQPSPPDFASQPLHATSPAPGLSQSFDQRSGVLPVQSMPAPPAAAPTTTRRSPESEGILKANTLSSSVDAAISNVDKALYEMQNREMERLSNRLNAAERDRKNAEEELQAEQRRRKGLEERVLSLEDGMRGMPPGSHPAPAPASTGVPPDVKRKLDMLEKQVTSLKQEKQIEEMKRLEAESAYKALERRTNENKNNNIQRQSLPGNTNLTIMQLEEKLGVAENRRREEEKKRAILEGKLRHAENTIKQQSPFKYQNMKTKKGPPAHMPDIAEGKEGEMMGGQALNLGVQPTARSPSLGAIDGPLPAALVPKWGSEEMQYVQVPGANGMMVMQHPAQQNGLYNSMGMNKPPGIQGPGSPNQGQGMARGMMGQPQGQPQGQGQAGMAPQRQPMPVPGGQLQASNPGRPSQGMYPPGMGQQGQQQPPPQHPGQQMHPGQQGMQQPPGQQPPGQPPQPQSYQQQPPQVQANKTPQPMLQPRGPGMMQQPPGPGPHQQQYGQQGPPGQQPMPQSQGAPPQQQPQGYPPPQQQQPPPQQQQGQQPYMGQQGMYGVQQRAQPSAQHYPPQQGGQQFAGQQALMPQHQQPYAGMQQPQYMRR